MWRNLVAPQAGDDQQPTPCNTWLVCWDVPVAQPLRPALDAGRMGAADYLAIALVFLWRTRFHQEWPLGSSMMSLDALYGFLTILAAMALATLPLAVVLPSSPPLDDATKRPPRSVVAGWRISITITRNE